MNVEKTMLKGKIESPTDLVYSSIHFPEEFKEFRLLNIDGSNESSVRSHTNFHAISELTFAGLPKICLLPHPDNGSTVQFPQKI